MKVAFLFFISFLLNCSYMNAISREENIALKLIGKFSKNAQKKNGIVRVGNGVKGKNEQIERITIAFQTNEPFTMNLSRKLLVETTEDLIRTINGNIAIKKYLTPYPFTHRNTSVSISTKSLENIGEPFVRTIYIIGDKIYYRNDEMKYPDFGCFYTETYEEALAILEKEDIERAKASSFN